MKRSYVKYDEILVSEVFEENYGQICKTTKHKKKIIKYDIFKQTNMTTLYDMLKHREYKHGRFNIFLISEPKYRIIMSENIRDKFVNHMVTNVFLKPVLYPRLIRENVATRIGMGTKEAILLCKRYFVRMMNKYDEFYILKFDIAKYFYNIDHDILKDMLKKIYVDEDVLKILFEIIDATDSDYIKQEIDGCRNREIKILSNQNIKEADSRISELNGIPYYNKGKGLGIGSVSSQVLAIFYLNSLDHYIKENLGIKEYVRFMDDGIIFSPEKDELIEIMNILRKQLQDLKLNHNKKTRIYSSSEGFEFVGYRFINRNGRLLVRLKNSTKKKMKRKFRVLDVYDKDKLGRVKASYNGFLQYCTTKSLHKKYFE